MQSKKKQFTNLFNQILDEINKESVDLDPEMLMRGDDVDLALDEREKSMLLKLQSRRDLYAKKIKYTLDKIDEGTFGECEECGDRIQTARLFARPTATMCIHCKEAEEQVEVAIVYKRRSHTLGKEIISNVV